MRLIKIITVLAIVFTSACSGKISKEVDYFGQTPPGISAKIFAPGIISLEDRIEQAFCYSPDGKFAYTSITNEEWSTFTIDEQNFTESGWSKPGKASFLSESGNGFTPVFYPGANEVYYPSVDVEPRNTNIWVSSFDNNAWGKPTKCETPVNSSASDWHVSFSNDSTMYLSTDREGGLGDIDIYVLKNVNGSYPEIQWLGEKVNSPHSDCNPIVSPDGSFIVFESTREGTIGGYDLYVTFRQSDNSWGEPINLGGEVNSKDHDMSVSFTPDMKYIIFSRRDVNYPASYGDIYWVSMDVVNSLNTNPKDELFKVTAQLQSPHIR